MKIGTIVKLKKEMLGNLPGTLGVVFNVYDDFDYPDKLGAQVIFQNGDYDGFSIKEQILFLEDVGNHRKKLICRWRVKIDWIK